MSSRPAAPFSVTNAYRRDSALVLNKAFLVTKKLAGKMSRCSALTSVHRWLILLMHPGELLPLPDRAGTNSVLWLQTSVAEVSPQEIFLVI